MLKYKAHCYYLFLDNSFLYRIVKRDYLKHLFYCCSSVVMNRPNRWQQPHIWWQRFASPPHVTSAAHYNNGSSLAYTSAYQVKQRYMRGHPSNATSPSAAMNRYYRAEQAQTAEERRNFRIDKLLNNRWYEYSEHGNAFYRSLDTTWQEFSVATYNILAQNLLEENIHLYRHCSHEYLKWEYRRNNLLKELKRLNSDILCLQEVMEEHYRDFLQPNLTKFGYEGVYKKKTGVNTMDGCAIFYRRAKFSCLAVHPVEYFDSKVSVLDRHNVGLVVHLRCKRSSERSDRKQHQFSSGEFNGQADICVATTHLLFNPKRGDVKLAQLMKLFTTIDEVARKVSVDRSGEYCPVIVCGDMNSAPFSDMYRFIRNRRLNCDEAVVPKMCARPDVLGNSLPQGRVLSRNFLSSDSGITDNCKRTSSQRQNDGNLGQEGSSLGFKGAFNTQGNQSVAVAKQSGDQNEAMAVEVVTQGSGVISHPFSLLSVYAHDSRKKIFDTEARAVELQHHGDLSESTSCHCAANDTVDYIFYMPHSRPSIDHSVPVSTDTVHMNGGSSMDLTSGENQSSQASDNHSQALNVKSSQSVTVQQSGSSNDVISIDDSSNSCASNQQNSSVTSSRADSSQSADQLRLLSRLRLPTVREMKFIGGLPNKVASSDHIPLLSVFAVKLQSDKDSKHRAS